MNISDLQDCPRDVELLVDGKWYPASVLSVRFSEQRDGSGRVYHQTGSADVMYWSEGHPIARPQQVTLTHGQVPVCVRRRATPPRILTAAEIATVQKVGRDEAGKCTTIGLVEFDSLCATAARAAELEAKVKALESELNQTRAELDDARTSRGTWREQAGQRALKLAEVGNALRAAGVLKHGDDYAKVIAELITHQDTREALAKEELRRRCETLLKDRDGARESRRALLRQIAVALAMWGGGTPPTDPHWPMESDVLRVAESRGSEILTLRNRLSEITTRACNQAARLERERDDAQKATVAAERRAAASAEIAETVAARNLELKSKEINWRANIATEILNFLLELRKELSVCSPSVRPSMDDLTRWYRGVVKVSAYLVEGK
jgi:hypothetical protein